MSNSIDPNETPRNSASHSDQNWLPTCYYTLGVRQWNYEKRCWTVNTLRFPFQDHNTMQLRRYTFLHIIFFSYIFNWFSFYFFKEISGIQEQFLLYKRRVKPAWKQITFVSLNSSIPRSWWELSSSINMYSTGPY